MKMKEIKFLITNEEFWTLEIIARQISGNLNKHVSANEAALCIIKNEIHKTQKNIKDA